MDERSNRERAEKAFRDWQEGTGYITDLLADDLRWTIVGRSQVSKTFDSKEQFIGEVLQPFGARFSEPFRPMHRRRLVQQLLCFHSSSVALDIQFLSNVFYVRPFTYGADDVFADLFPLFVVARTAKGLVPMRPTLASHQVFSFRPCEPDRNLSLAP